MSNKTICFDVDGTLIHQSGSYTDTPRYEVIRLLEYFYHLGWTVHIWSGGGVPYAQQWAERLGLHHMTTVIAKGSMQPDIAVDDCEAELGRVTIYV